MTGTLNQSPTTITDKPFSSTSSLSLVISSAKYSSSLSTRSSVPEIKQLNVVNKCFQFVNSMELHRRINNMKNCIQLSINNINSYFTVDLSTMHRQTPPFPGKNGNVRPLTSRCTLYNLPLACTTRRSDSENEILTPGTGLSAVWHLVN